MEGNNGREPNLIDATRSAIFIVKHWKLAVIGLLFIIIMSIPLFFSAGMFTDEEKATTVSASASFHKRQSSSNLATVSVSTSSRKGRIASISNNLDTEESTKKKLKELIDITTDAIDETLSWIDEKEKAKTEKVSKKYKKEPGELICNHENLQPSAYSTLAEKEQDALAYISYFLVEEYIDHVKELQNAEFESEDSEEDYSSNSKYFSPENINMKKYKTRLKQILKKTIHYSLNKTEVVDKPVTRYHKKGNKEVPYTYHIVYVTCYFDRWKDSMDKVAEDYFGLQGTNYNSLGGSIDNYYNVWLPSKLSADDINKYLASKPMKGMGDTIVKIESKYGVSSLYTLAVAQMESNCGDSDYTRKYNNPYSIGGTNPRTYKTLSEGVMAFGKLMMGDYYFHKSITEIGSHYCTPPDHWIKTTVQIMGEIKEFFDKKGIECQVGKFSSKEEIDENKDPDDNEDEKYEDEPIIAPNDTNKKPSNLDVSHGINIAYSLQASWYELLYGIALDEGQSLPSINYSSKEFKNYILGKNFKEVKDFNMPLSGNKKYANINSKFGMRLHPIFNDLRMHTGIDMACGMNTKIYTLGNGYVMSAGLCGGYGNLLVIYQGELNGIHYFTSYAHLNNILVRPGQYVTKGQIVALTGTTGNSTGPHLHMEMHSYNEDTKKTLLLNPEPFFSK